MDWAASRASCIEQLFLAATAEVVHLAGARIAIESVEGFDDVGAVDVVADLLALVTKMVYEPAALTTLKR